MGRVWILFACLSAFAASTQGQNPCPYDDWKLFVDGSTCVKSFIDPMTFSEAEKFCADQYSQLVAVKNSNENKAVKSMTGRRGSWIGVSDKNKDGTFEYPNGEPITYDSWNRWEPNNRRNEEYCVVTRNEMWSDVNCEEINQVVCQMPKDTDVSKGLPDNDKPSGGVCPDDTWSYYGDGSSCVKHFRATVNFEGAERFCARRNSIPVAIKSRGDNERIKALIAGQKLSWIGIVDRNRDRNFEYPNGDLITFDSWSRGEPDNRRRGEYCVFMQTDGYWSDISCDNTFIGVVCQTQKSA